jgi:hypothetical protein
MESRRGVAWEDGGMVTGSFWIERQLAIPLAQRVKRIGPSLEFIRVTSRGPARGEFRRQG